ncbi:MAG: 3-phosphoserine/phosphohydroxythreonine transaminase [Flavobacteriales bacterium]|nr:3-phosphoserine/phosphohydroxythreonine transaminase [Flavobacteriales bacterium]
MSKIHNFSAGPAVLPKEAIEESIDALRNFAGTGLSLLEVSHRGKEFVEVMDQACASVRELMGLTDEYAVVYLQGGASTQFLMVAMNCLQNKAGYLDTGTWASNAIKEAKLFGEVSVLGSSKETGYDHIPKGYTIPADLDYFHCTSNNTIFGTQMQEFPDSPVPMICDMSSDIFSRQLDFSKFDLIYAGAQKNIGPAGVTLVVIKKELLGKVNRVIPTMLDYRTHISKESMFNTPPVFPVFVVWRTLEWVKKHGLAEIEAINNSKADLLYSEIDRNGLFRGVAQVEDRSRMNVTFDLVDQQLSPAFLECCKEAGISGVKGHRSVGGFRASIYNALGLESVEALVDVMRNFKA